MTFRETFNHNTLNDFLEQSLSSCLESFTGHEDYLKLEAAYDTHLKALRDALADNSLHIVDAMDSSIIDILLLCQNYFFTAGFLSCLKLIDYDNHSGT